MIQRRIGAPVLVALALLAPAPAGARNKAARMQRASHHLQVALQGRATCLSASAQRFAAIEESVDLVISAAFGECSTQETLVREAWLPVYTYSHPSVDTLAAGEDGAAHKTSNARDRLREQMIGLILRERALRAKKGG
ncbi:MAG: hypothetical protein WC804_17350 [Sphingomonas sp.]|jgi:hypothetical protein|uniref:hypothetical protein n=1 Tax=Sphingomonas sp. TaxID=28214 RepID=UPI003568771F